MVTERVSVLIPMRDEAPRAAACVDAVVGQLGVPDLEVVVLDDGSSDGTGDVVQQVLTRAARANCRLVSCPDVSPPEGWLGKPWASSRLVEESTGSVLVFIDADVVLAPDAVACAVSLLRELQVDLVSPYPRQLAAGVLPRLVQPLLQWSWLTTVPLRWSESSPRPSLAVANGQFLVVDRQAYLASGGFAAVRGEVLDDVALLRGVKASGGRGTVVDGTTLATCHMYETGSALVDGYTKSLWSAFGSPAGATAAMSVLAIAYLVPPAAALGARTTTTRLIGLGGYAAAIAGRALVARITGARVLPDVLGHPASIASLATLTALSWSRRRRGTLQWKGRMLDGASSIGNNEGEGR